MLRIKKDIEWAHDNLDNPLAEPLTDRAARFLALADENFWAFFDCWVIVEYWARGQHAADLAYFEMVRLERAQERFKLKKMPGWDGADLPLHKKNVADLGVMSGIN
jgi:hypothetical protein